MVQSKWVERPGQGVLDPEGTVGFASLPFWRCSGRGEMSWQADASPTLDAESKGLWYVGGGAILIAGATFNIRINLNAIPSIWSGLIFEVLATGVVGAALVLCGTAIHCRLGASAR